MNISTPEDTLFKFPCKFPIKVMGDMDETLEDFVRNCITAQIQDKKSLVINTRQSSGGNYLSITATFIAHSKAELDALYEQLSAHDKIKMVL